MNIISKLIPWSWESNDFIDYHYICIFYCSLFTYSFLLLNTAQNSYIEGLLL